MNDILEVHITYDWHCGSPTDSGLSSIDLAPDAFPTWVAMTEQMFSIRRYGSTSCQPLARYVDLAEVSRLGEILQRNATKLSEHKGVQSLEDT